MTVTITALDGTLDTVTPVLIDGWAPTARSGNIIHDLLTPGQIAVVLRGDMPRSGNLELLFDDDTDAEDAREILGRPTTFELEDTDRPVVDMTFVRVDTISPAMFDGLRAVWTFSVGYQEIIP